MKNSLSCANRTSDYRKSPLQTTLHGPFFTSITTGAVNRGFLHLCTFVGIDNVLNQAVAHDIRAFQLDQTDPLDPAEFAHGIVQAAAAPTDRTAW